MKLKYFQLKLLKNDENVCKLGEIIMLRHVELGNIKIHCALRKHISNVLK
jgi:hypothetical protein